MTVSRGMATALGAGAVASWSTLALLTAASGAVPPFLLLALCMGAAAALGAAVYRGRLLGALRQPLAVWALGVGGLFGYHALYFFALRHAPVAEAGLVAYLWPLLIVLFSGLLPGERLRWFHVAGALCGFLGATVLLLGAAAGGAGGAGAGAGEMVGAGFAAAGACALVWSGYSVLSRRFAAVPTAAVTGFVAVSAVLGLVCHLLFEETRWPETAGGWLAVALLGAGPVGGAFFLWDAGVKRGHLQALGALSYAAPLLSTLLLIVAGYAEWGGRLALACALIAGGAALAAKDELFNK